MRLVSLRMWQRAPTGPRRSHYQRPPQVAEFEWWRQREPELAAAQGDDTLHLPSQSPYRKRWGSWEGALLHFGYSAAEIAERLEQP
jgi:hypothetical protein